MKRDQRARANRLLDAMGGIDDRFLNEAILYRTARPPIRHSLRNFMAVAAVAALLLVAVTGPLSGLLDLDKSSDSIPPEQSTETTSKPTTLDGLLKGCTESLSFTAYAPDTDTFFDGGVRLTVEDRATGTLYVSRPLSTSEQNTLLREFQASAQQVAPTESPVTYRVWVLLGDGRVVTPCLNPARGTVGYGTLFDYESERVPTELFLKLLTNLQ